MRNVLAVLILLLVLLVVLVNYTPFQNFLVRQATETLSSRLHTKVGIQHVRIDFLNHLLVQGVFVEDQAHDTLLYAGEVKLRITDWFLFRERTVVHYAALSNAYVHLYRTTHAAAWNYDFLVDAFSSPANKEKKGQKPIDLDLQKLEVSHTRFHMDDQWNGQDIDVDLGSFLLRANRIDIPAKSMDIDEIKIDQAVVRFADYSAAHPSMKKIVVSPFLKPPTPFNPGLWKIKASKLELHQCQYRMQLNNHTPVPGEFDENHLDVSNIELVANKMGIVGDTLHANLDKLSAHERCGINIRKLKAKITVSPNASICDQLSLETDYSSISDYYAMHYHRFEDFLEYIDSVKMTGRLRNSTVDMRDIAFFGPAVRQLPQLVLKASGEATGTVSDLHASRLSISDGNSVLRGNVTMTGLPNIYKTRIKCTELDLLTNGKGICRYAPGLATSPDIDMSRLVYAWFRGGFDGFIEHFTVNGMIASSLGSIGGQCTLDMPGFSPAKAAYSGNLVADHFQAGALLRQSVLGSISLSEHFTGESFDPDLMKLDIEGNVPQVELNNYNYVNISTKGTVARKEFTGQVMVDDPNMALEFDGQLDYNDRLLKVKAAAHLLHGDFQALKLTADQFTAAADFDLNCTGSNIDNFHGYAKLYDLDIRRKGHRLDVDSVYLRSEGDSTNRNLVLLSNNVSASVSGRYQLSKLAPSVQFYLSRYLPNYVKAPASVAPEQDLQFHIRTYAIDSVLAVTTGLFRGFDNAELSGSLNTNAHKLTLGVTVPSGAIGKFRLDNINISGSGNYDVLGLNTSVDNVTVGDSLVNGSLGITATVGNDTVGFTVATTTADVGSSITLNGMIVARKDTLFLQLNPSQISINQQNWDIASGCRAAWADKYLFLSGFSLSSGLQRITAATDSHTGEQTLSVAAENVDLGQLSAGTGLAAYQPDGRLNGTFEVQSLFVNPTLVANLKATHVVLGADTVGTISVIGSYNLPSRLLRLDPQTGIYRDEAALSVSGSVSFDTVSDRQVAGEVSFSKVPASWASPFLAGLFSHISGTIDGTTTFTGSTSEPSMEGTVTLKNAGFRLDYMGCAYTVPQATVKLDNNNITFGKTTLYDASRNTATLTGSFSHHLFSNMKMNLKLRTEKFEVMNLTSADNNLFYGYLLARADSFTIRGPFNDVRLNAYGAAPAGKSRFYIPETSSGTGAATGNYTFASFKVYGKNQGRQKKISRNKLAIYIESSINPLAEMHIVLDPVTGDEIMARGNGRLTIDLPANNDINLAGDYEIDEGIYSFSIKSLRFKRQFVLEPKSTISFNGPFNLTSLNVKADYVTKARLIDLLTDHEQSLVPSELADDQAAQPVDVRLTMDGLLSNPRLSYNIDLENKNSQSSLAYQKLRLINNDELQKLNQVVSLLLINSFIPPEGVGSAVGTGAINNISQVVSSSTSSALTSVINKFLNRQNQVTVDVKYTNYNYSDQFVSTNVSELKADLKKSYFDDRLLVEVGSTSDWGRPTSASSTSNFNLTGDFRLQYKLIKSPGLRLNAFRTTDYDVTLERYIVRSGAGLTWRKSFDRPIDFFRGYRYEQRKKNQQQAADTEDADSAVIPAPDTTHKK